MNSDPAVCPLCGRENACQFACTDAYKGQCWCVLEDFPPELLACLPEDTPERTCICRRCVIEARFAAARARPQPRAAAGDFYFEQSRVVFTAAYLRRRGYCCGSGCRHCPYDPLEREVALSTASGTILP